MLKFLSNTVKKVFGTKTDRDVKAVMPLVDATNEQFELLQNVSTDELRAKTLDFRARIKAHLEGITADIEEVKAEVENTADFAEKESLFEDVDALIKERDQHLEDILLEILPEAFAVVKETARRFKENDTITVKATELDRELAANNNKEYVSIDGDQSRWQTSWTAAGAQITWDMVHYDVQLIGGIVLHQGKIAEMQTGEGKTLVATLPAYLNGLSGEGVHVVTVNDYLARRDCEWIGPVLEFLGLTIDCIDRYRPHSEERKAAYRCDIVYGTNNEFGFDYLRDNMVRSQGELVQGKHHFAMIDEIDSVLIDDARTPLIISGPVDKGDEHQYASLKPYVEKIVGAQRKITQDYLVEAKKLFKEGNLGTDEGQAGMALLRAHHGLPKHRPLIKFLGEQGVKVEMQKTENYYMQEQSKNMHVVDDELFFVIDEKNNIIDLTDKGADFLAKLNADPDFFVMPDIAEEMMKIEASDMPMDEQDSKKQTLIADYTVKAERLHSISQLLKAYTLFERDDQYLVIDGQVKIVDEQTGRTMEGRRYSDGLHQALEVKENVKVGDLTQTYATVTLQNYFRMYHKLAGMTGTAETEAGEFWEIYKLDVVVIPTNRPIARQDKEDLVFKTEREKFNAVITEIVKLAEAGRPILVGTTSVEYSEKLSRILRLKNIDHNVLNAKQHQREAQIVAEAGNPGKVTIATNMAGRGTDIKLSDEVKAAGGLAIIATERHDSRRVDRQLRGRSGRQGDPGSSQFYVSLEDKLMRLFHSERIAKLMDKMGYQEGEVIQHNMVTKSIERAQKRVEENNFGIRKRLLEYDDVMNIQREAIYKRRHNALSGERLSLDIFTMFLELADELVRIHKPSADFKAYRFDMIRYFGVEPDVTEQQFADESDEALIRNAQDLVVKTYREKNEQIRKSVLPVVQRVHREEGHKYKRILIPLSDGGEKRLDIAADLQEAIDSDGKSVITDIEKMIALGFIDQEWKEHLRSMDELKESVQSASFEQKDPLVIYKVEAYDLFEGLMSRINRDAVSFLSRAQILVNPNDRVQEARQRKTDMSRTRTNEGNRQVVSQQSDAERVQQHQAPQRVETVRRQQPKVGRNEPCPCGSGKKYKQCHGRPSAS